MRLGFRLHPGGGTSFENSPAFRGVLPESSDGSARRPEHLGNTLEGHQLIT